MRGYIVRGFEEEIVVKIVLPCVVHYLGEKMVIRTSTPYFLKLLNWQRKRDNIPMYKTVR